MLKQYLKFAPNHWIYRKRDHSEVWQPYYVHDISYTPPKKDHYGYRPGYVTVVIMWEELGDLHKSTLTFHAEEVEDMTPGLALSAAGWQVEDEESKATYLENKKKYLAIYNKIGLQFEAVGLATDDVDTADDDDERYWHRSSTIRLDRDGVPARVVVDVLNESGKENKDKGRPPTLQFWQDTAADREGKEGDDDNDIGPGDEEEAPVTELAEVPLAPALPCFDLKRHKRLRIYVDQLTQYEYQTDLADKLIVPNEVTNLVNMLVEHKGGFQDIVGGKSGGAIILCAGKPGTGKTLTAEVYSEAMSRPLYSVQCSQLGTDPNDLEKELLKVFRRAQRWDSILLLDECDVYVAARGSDLQQNAIVGVFLRVLEYYSGVMFMTTNRADLVDDAIASRCLARIDYKVPTPEDQARIWKALSETSGVAIKPAEVQAIVKENPGLSGRDVKNLLKLAWMVCKANGADAVNAKTVKFVRQFKPTADLE
jgi:hypothetical protein